MQEMRFDLTLVVTIGCIFTKKKQGHNKDYYDHGYYNRFMFC